jgi:hypothetical protein
MKSKTYIYEGILEAYYETGFEGCHLAILLDKRGETPNPDFDPESKKWPTNVPVFRTLEWAHTFKTGDELEVFDPEGKSLFKGLITRNRQPNSEHVIDFFPKEIPEKRWIEWLVKEYKAKVITKRQLDIEKKKEIVDSKEQF